MVGSFVAILAFAVSSDSCFCCYSGGVTIEDFFSYNRLAFSNRKLAQQKQHIFFFRKISPRYLPFGPEENSIFVFCTRRSMCVLCSIVVCVCVCVCKNGKVPDFLKNDKVQDFLKTAKIFALCTRRSMCVCVCV